MSADLLPVDRDLFRGLLRRQASTVTVVTAVARGTDPACLGGIGAPLRAGFTATSFTSVSLDPPLVSFCLGVASSSWPVLARAEHVAVHLLAADQSEAARIFATSGIDRFAAYRGWTPGPFGLPLLDGVLGRLLCRVVHRVPAGDHTVVIAEPLTLAAGADAEPLVYHRGGYTSTAATAVAA
ncbi:flavin reductase (DIM6/NTAB) family NADH-FMN oxidoreductase RutF [Micromonospora palomenae]|uniref:Flavin reductase (DIM6/NTAB) family NADH-FMN oxidoreductase RutF n=1 Tax=Micromonospora palomenae TaxID=1461247 RepID=A0A561VK42_9ACTN|nr:flavin reductase family protein [Micromonospora palomenae]TWG11970.1 flavin reductase (DIM6/NTAB) family NADH-FMN oxidoreductase RutF [Micromonospora palomenae]